jgi:hypothetical protein
VSTAAASLGDKNNDALPLLIGSDEIFRDLIRSNCLDNSVILLYLINYIFISISITSCTSDNHWSSFKVRVRKDVGFYIDQVPLGGKIMLSIFILSRHYFAVNPYILKHLGTLWPMAPPWDEAPRNIMGIREKTRKDQVCYGILCR